MKSIATPSEQYLETLRGRKATRRKSELLPETSEALNQGWIETKNLVEWLSVDRAKLFDVVIDELELAVDNEQRAAIDDARRLSALKFSFVIGEMLSKLVPITNSKYKLLCSHPSDVVREWAAILVGFAPDLTLKRRLAWVKTQADDPNPSTREIAWMALRNHVSSDVTTAIELLVPWTGSRNERVRRFASEISRPCGVWTAHIECLKVKPWLAEPILEPLRSDPSKYVRNSVSNWINDASKYQPEWAREITSRWAKESPTDETAAIVKRALRFLER